MPETAVTTNAATDDALVVSSTPAARTDHRDRWIFAALLVAGFVLRVALARSVWKQPDGDEAAGLVMAYRAAHGHFALIFEGGNYGGTLSSWIEAPFVALFGLHWWLFWIINTAMALGSCFVLRAVARSFLTPTAAAVAAGTFFFFPPFWLFWSSREYEFWNPAILLALTVSLFTVRWFEHRRTKTLYALGFATGLALWSYPLIASLILPPLAIFVWAERRNPGAWLRAGAAAVAGLLPWIAFVVLHGRSALHGQAVTDSRMKALQQSINKVLPAALLSGQKRFAEFWTTEPFRLHLFGAVGVVVYVVALVCLAVFAVRRQVAMAACCASVALWPVVLILGHVPLAESTARYGLVAVPPLLLLAASLLSRVRLSLVLAVAALAYSVAITGANTDYFARSPACTPGMRALADRLEAEQRTAVWASYWLAGNLTYCSDGRITAVSATPPTRDGTGERITRRAGRSTYVAFAGNGLDKDIERYVARHDLRATRTLVGGFAVWEFANRVLASDIHSGSAF